ncbi:plasmid stabilization system protein [Rubrivivax gelatinosus]|nr:plasmid stabilization system protein [Rubrivivax gelatinosus]
MSAVRFLPEAARELLHEVEYDSKARTGVGIRFQAAVEAALERAVRRPMGGAPSPQATRSVLVKGFPFSSVYRPSPDGWLDVAVAPHRRRSDYWSARLGEA